MPHDQMAVLPPISSIEYGQPSDEFLSYLHLLRWGYMSPLSQEIFHLEVHANQQQPSDKTGSACVQNVEVEGEQPSRKKKYIYLGLIPLQRKK
mmetsp:Transcript_41641/g.71292  ORF Transcript_41641/g.71292 Transcript_41641/m.71292 type:complete len:93 (+) Transcript_41641:305-583(+)